MGTTNLLAKCGLLSHHHHGDKILLAVSGVDAADQWMRPGKFNQSGSAQKA